jgi:beta-1,4-mannosyltransferase
MATALRELGPDSMMSRHEVAPQHRLRVAQWPVQRAGASGYVTLLAGALERADVEIITPDARELWRLGWTRNIDVVHLHWLEFVAPSAPSGVAGLARTLIRHVRLMALLAWLRMRGIALVWTVHNLRPHEPTRPRLESLLSRVVSRICHVLVAHSAYARERIQECWGASLEVAVIPLGNYIAPFPAGQASRAELRATLGIPGDAYVFLAFGQVRPYKRLPDLVTAFRGLSGDDVRLLIVGKPVVADEARRLREAAAHDPRVLLDLREVPDAEVSGVHLCADAAVLAYRDVFSSGALLLALSFGLPVVAPDVGTAAEIAGPSASELFKPGCLTDALDRSRTADRRARTQAARAVAEQYDWADVASDTTALYWRLVRTRRSRSGGHRAEGVQVLSGDGVR